MNQPKVKYSLSNWDLVTVNPNYKTWDWKDLFCFDLIHVLNIKLINSTVHIDSWGAIRQSEEIQ